PVSDYYALIGNTDNLVSIRNEADSAAVKVIREDEASSVELGGEQEALFGIPANRRLSLELKNLASLSFGFCKQYSSFVFATQGCIEINGREECCGELSYTEAGSPDVSNSTPEERETPPSVETPDPGGGYVPPKLPPIKPGSPILPLP
ncbi:MAG: hypothetical protein GY801_04820, partial [bacterium]|nr:hypothetical protein [bacterium]